MLVPAGKEGGGVDEDAFDFEAPGARRARRAAAAGAPQRHTGSTVSRSTPGPAARCHAGSAKTKRARSVTLRLGRRAI